jgi:hypothetical protein
LDAGGCLIRIQASTVSALSWHMSLIGARREAWHRPSVDGFVETMQRLRWGEVGFASLRTWGTLGNNYWWGP